MALNGRKPDSFPLYGFVHAPCSKTLLFVTGISTLGATLLPIQYRHIFNLRWSFVTENAEVWRLLTYQLAYDSAVDFMYGSIMLYYFRVLERRWGSRKYASFLFAVSSMSAALHFALYYCRDTIPYRLSENVACGLFGPLFAALIYYVRDIPSGNVAGQTPIPISNKILIYLMALKLLTGNKISRDTCILGLISGIVYRCNFLWVQYWLRIPSWSANAFGWIYSCFTGASTSSSEFTVMGATEEVHEDMVFDHLLRAQSSLTQGPRTGRQRVGQGYSDVLQPSSGIFRDLLQPPGLQNANNARAEEVVIPEEKIQKLVEMGFAREAVVDALSSTNSDVQEATSLLLSR